MVQTEYVSPISGRKFNVVNIWSMVSRSMEEVIIEGEYYAGEVAKMGYMNGFCYPYETVLSVHPAKLRGPLEVEENSMLQLDVVIFPEEKDRRIYVEDELRLWNKKIID